LLTPMAPDAIPPLLDWVITAAVRPVAVQCILERFFSPQALQCVRAAAELALNGGAAQGPLVLPSHLALAALSTPHPDCAAALGVVHYGGLRLGCCEQLLLAAAEAEAARAGARGTSSSSSQDGIFSPAAQHFLFQSYRWAVYTGHDSVLPCHLLWALSADPRVAYSWDRRDPLDPAVQPWQDWRPPLVGLMEAAVGLKLLERPAPLYEQLLGVLQYAISTAPIQGPPAASTSNPAAPSTSPAAPKVSQLHQALADRLTGACSRSDMEEVFRLVRSCRAVGLVLSRAQLHAIDQLVLCCADASAPQIGMLLCQDIIGAAALGYKSHAASTRTSLSRLYCTQQPPGTGCSALAHVDGPAAPSDPTVEVACQLAAALRFFGVDGARCTDLSWLRCEGPSQPLAQQVDELLLLSDTLEAVDARSISSSSQTLRSLLAGRAAMLLRALGGTNEPAPNAAIAAYIAATATTTAAELQLLPWPTDGVAPRWLKRLTLQQRVRLLAHLAHVSKAARASPSTPVIDTSALVTTAAAVNRGSASVHASLALQRQAAVALAAAGQPLAEGWLRQLASYGAVASKPASDALLAVLAALDLRSLYKAGDEAATGLEDASLAVLLAAGTARWGNLASLAALAATVYGSYTMAIDHRQQLAFLGVDPALPSSVVDRPAAGGAGEEAAGGGPTEQQQQAGGPDPLIMWSLLWGGAAPDARNIRGAGVLLRRMDEQLRSPATSGWPGSAGGRAAAADGATLAAAQLSAEVGAAVLSGSFIPSAYPWQCLQLLVGELARVAEGSGSGGGDGNGGGGSGGGGGGGTGSSSAAVGQQQQQQ
ncbi:hypothetical protein TSOC_005961, partial [Tetrabaena socialis]